MKIFTAIFQFVFFIPMVVDGQKNAVLKHKIKYGYYFQVNEDGVKEKRNPEIPDSAVYNFKLSNLKPFDKTKQGYYMELNFAERVEEGYRINGVKEGESREYYKDKIQYLMNYKNGDLDGIRIDYNDDGSIKSVHVYKGYRNRTHVIDHSSRKPVVTQSFTNGLSDLRLGEKFYSVTGGGFGLENYRRSRKTKKSHSKNGNRYLSELIIEYEGKILIGIPGYDTALYGLTIVLNGGGRARHLKFEKYFPAEKNSGKENLILFQLPARIINKLDNFVEIKKVKFKTKTDIKFVKHKYVHKWWKRHRPPPLLRHIKLK